MHGTRGGFFSFLFFFSCKIVKFQMLCVKQCPTGESQGGKCEVQLEATLKRAINSSCFYCVCQVLPVS